MQRGRGGMGSHKHGTSGISGPSPRAKLRGQMDANSELDRKAAVRERKKTPMVHSVAKLLGIQRKKR